MENGERLDIHERLASLETILKSINEKLKCLPEVQKSVERVKGRVVAHEMVVGAIIAFISLIARSRCSVGIPSFPERYFSSQGRISGLLQSL